MSNSTDGSGPWDIQAARNLYNIHRWGAEYFDINEAGHVVAKPLRDAGASVDLTDVIEEARARGLKFPVLIRFQDILRHRVECLNLAFRNSIAEFNYQGRYRGVFPIKVNQLREVVEEIAEAGRPFHLGIEAGSKPELLAALALHGDPESLIICNGYKDSQYIHSALLGNKLGSRVIMVVEKLEELFQILRISKEMNVEPMIGLRVRLQSKGSGKWATSGGENAKFGLSTADLVRASETLRQEGLAHCLKLVHFHVGSQVPDIGTIKRAVREAARFYSKLAKLGHELGYLDVGGGLGVDYDGSNTAFDSSTNYTLQEYARDVVYNIMDVCDSEEVANPVIVSESGRALVAHHSVLVVEAFGAIEKYDKNAEVSVKPTDHKLARDMWDIEKNLTPANRTEMLHDAQEIKEQTLSMFNFGLMDLESKAKIEQAYWRIASRTVEIFQSEPDQEYVPDEIKELEVALGDQYVCNFSVFQSLLDHWALGQLFPVMPIHRLDEKPDRHATLVDITCDSDGKVSKFIDLQDVKETLPLHALEPDKPYYIGFFLMGAYQDIMGDLHNLFGRVNEAHVFLDDDEEDGFYIEETIEGSTIAEVLSMTQWNQSDLIRRFKKQVDVAIKSDRLKPNEGMKLLTSYERSLKNYTYLHIQNGKA